MLRLIHGVRKLAAGLHPFGESVWPGLRNDLFVAHESIYEFFCGFVEGRRVLDAGCGTGYGTFRLTSAGAASAIGVDLDDWSVRFAQRRYRAPNLSFVRGDLERLTFPDASFDVIVASNSLEHLRRPGAFVSTVRRLVTAEGTVLIAVPPIVTEADARAHAGIHYHRSNLAVRDWYRLFEASGFVPRCLSHRPANGNVRPDFTSRRSSRYTVDDFVFVATDLEGLYAEPGITAIFILNRPVQEHS